MGIISVGKIEPPDAPHSNLRANLLWKTELPSNKVVPLPAKKSVEKAEICAIMLIAGLGGELSAFIERGFFTSDGKWKQAIQK